MKKFIALTLVTVCLAGFSLGCGSKKTEAPKPAEETTAPAEGDATAAPAAEAAAE